MGSCNGMLLKLTEEKKSFKRTLQATKMEIQRQPNESFFQVCELIILIIDLEGKQRDASMLRYSSGLLGRFQFKDKARKLKKRQPVSSGIRWWVVDAQKRVTANFISTLGTNFVKDTKL